MNLRQFTLLGVLMTTGIAGCLNGDDGTGDGGGMVEDPFHARLVDAKYTIYTLPAQYQEPLGLYEPTMDVSDEGTIYVTAHSTGVGEHPAPAYYSLDDGVTWDSMGNLLGQDAGPEEQNSGPILSDEIFIVAADDGTAWGMDCCSKLGTTTNPVTDADPTGLVGTGLGVAGLVTPDSELPLVGWCQDGAEVCYYNENAMDHASYIADADLDCVPYFGTDRPWVAYNNGMLLLVNNPGTAILSNGEILGPIPLQVGALTVPPAIPIAYSGLPWGIQWNLCGSTGGYIPGIPDMRADHFFAVPQWSGPNGCGGDTQYHVITGTAPNVDDLTEVVVFTNSHVAPKEDDSASPSNIGLYGQAVFDADGALYVGAMNNSAARDGDGNCIADPDDGGIHFAYSTDDAASFVETTFRFHQPVSAFFMDGNRHGEGFLLNWGQIDGNNTDWYLAHVFPNDDGTLRLENVMLAVDDGPEASRHVQGAALGPDGRAYMTFSYNSNNPGTPRPAVGDTPLRVAVQQDGPTMPVRST